MASSGAMGIAQALFRWASTLLALAQEALRFLLLQRSHTYLRYPLTVRGNIGSEAREFLVGLDEDAHAKYQFQSANTVSGEPLPVADPRLETVELYKVSNVKVTADQVQEETPPPPWRGVPPPLRIHRERGDRRLAARTYEEKCTKCI